MVSYWSQNFDGVPECVARVREYTRKVVGDCEGADVLELIASELASNAIRHSHSGEPGGQFTLHLAVFRDRWQIRVDDAGGPRTPEVCDLAPFEGAADLDTFGEEIEAGRGLALVAAMSSEWGVLGDQAARAVWAEILIPEETAKAGV